MEKLLEKYRDDDQVDIWETLMFLYDSALKEVSTKISILNAEFVHVHKYNPIEHTKTRLKTPESIVAKLKRQEREDTLENMVHYINDIAGARIVCSFVDDVYSIVDMIRKQGDLTILSEQDFILKPKISGYKSYHLLVSVPIFMLDRAVDVKVEIQVRTIAMDFWASLEHKIYYKFEGHAPDYISQDLRACAKMVSQLDEHMMKLNDTIVKYKE